MSCMTITSVQSWSCAVVGFADNLLHVFIVIVIDTVIVIDIIVTMCIDIKYNDKDQTVPRTISMTMTV